MKILLDSNILIEAARPGSDSLLAGLGSEERSLSSIARGEVLGYHELGDQEKRDLETLIAATTEILPTIETIDRAILLRQARKMSPRRCPDRGDGPCPWHPLDDTQHCGLPPDRGSGLDRAAGV